MTDDAIIAEALGLGSAAERAAFLDRACDGPDQRGRVEAELGTLVQNGDTDRTVTALHIDPHPAPAGDDNTRTTEPRAAGPADETLEGAHTLAASSRPGSLGRIGHYEVLRVLGQGGFGIVYRAFDEKLHREVAVKVLAPHLATTSAARQRFLREARAGAAVDHPNVVRVHAVEEQPLPHLVMEFVPGESLQERIDRDSPPPLPEVLRVGRQVADGLAAAHATGLIHRDIKPSNILLDAATPPAARITDFGLARAADDASLTRSGTVAGTPMYMAPEQARGERVDQRADLFSLGSVLYALATGRPPFAAGSTLAVLKRVAEDDPRPVREVRPDLPDWFARIVAKLHAKDPAERFQTAREVADLLADCERQLAEGDRLTDTSRIPVAKSPAKRKWGPVVLALVGLVLLLCVSLPVVALVFWLTPTYATETKPKPTAEVTSPAPGPASDADRLLGEWVVVTAGPEGKGVVPKVGEEPTFRFTEKLLTVTTPGSPAVGVAYRLDPARRELLVESEVGDGTLRPIGYRFDGDRLRLTPPAGLFRNLMQTGRQRSLNNLIVMGIALHNYEATYGCLPPAGLPAPKGDDPTPLLSWRVAILPYIEQEHLYRQFHHDEPWDSEHNKKLIAKMPKEFAVPELDTPPGHTHYQTFAGPGTALEPGKDPRKASPLFAMPDGTSNTLLVVEAAEPVVWTKPEDLPFDPKKPMPKLRVADGGVNVAFADGSVKTLDGPVKDGVLRRLIDRNDGEVVTIPERPSNSTGPVVLECVRKSTAPSSGK